MSTTDVIPIAFGKLDESGDPKAMPPGTMLVAENCAMDKERAIIKRDGTKHLAKTIAGGGSLAAGARLVVRGDELAIIDGGNLYAWSAVMGTWQNQGPISETGLTWTTLINYEGGVQACDVGITSDGRVVTAWVDGDPTGLTFTQAIYIQVIDRGQDARISSPAKFAAPASCTSVRVLVNGTNYMVVWDDGANIKCAMNGGTIRTLRTDAQNLAKPLAFDACALGANFAIAYEKAPVASISRVDVYKYTFADPPVQLATNHFGDVNNGGVQSFTCLGIDGGVGDLIWVAWGGVSLAGGVRGLLATVDEPTLASVSTVFSMWTLASGTAVYQSAGVCRVDATHAAWSFSATAGSLMVPGVVVSGQSTSAGTISSLNFTSGMRMLSRPFLLGGKVYVALTESAVTPNGSNFNPRPNSYLACIESDVSAANIWVHRVCGKIDALIGAGWRVGYLTGVAYPSSTEALVCMPFQGAVVPTNASAYLGPQRNGVRLVSVTIGTSLPVDMWRNVQFEREAFIGAGMFQAYDGRTPLDYGFNNAPALDSSTTGTTPGGSIANGTYLYSLAPEFVSATGMLYRGPVLPPWSIAVPGAGSGSTVLKIVPPSLSPKQKRAEALASSSPVLPIIALHRSTVGAPNIYRETAEPRLNLISPDFGNALTTFTDTRNDSDIGNATALNKRAALYTSGGELEDHQPPACLTFTRYGTRLALISGDKRTVWITKDYASNVGTAPGFHPNLIFAFQDDLTALGLLDSKLIVTSRSAMWLIEGALPAANGQGGNAEPFRIQSDVGCTNPRSMVATPFGLAFLSTRGLELLSRDLTVEWIGHDVEDTIAAYPNVTSAVLVPAKHEVRWTANNAAGNAGVVIVWDYIHKTFFVRKYTDVQGSVASTPIADAVLYKDVWTFVTPTGQVYQEDATTRLDDGTLFVARDIQLSWFSPAGNLRRYRMKTVSVLGTSKTNHDLEVSVARDYAVAWEQVKTFPASTAAGSATTIGPLEKARVMLKNQKGQAFRVRLRDLSPSGGLALGTGDGPIWEALAFQVALKDGVPQGAPNQEA